MAVLCITPFSFGVTALLPGPSSTRIRESLSDLEVRRMALFTFEPLFHFWLFLSGVAPRFPQVGQLWYCLGRLIYLFFNVRFHLPAN